jgi:thiosulfate/3-mercaptopyruvate sulfurtransferase
MTDISEFNLKLVSVEQFIQNKNDLLEHYLIWDFSSLEAFAEGSLPNAYHCPQMLTRFQGNPVGNPPPKDQWIQTLIQLDYQPDKPILLLDDSGGTWAGRAAWLLDWIGHTQWYYLNGGRQAWIEAGQPLESGTPFSPELKQPLFTQPIEFHDFPWIQVNELIDLVNNKPETIQIWDARSEAEYEGLLVKSSRSGHIPHAIHLEWSQCLEGQSTRLKPLTELALLLKNRGFVQNKPCITHCQTHHRSGLTYLVGRILGYPMRAYAGSWQEWGSLLHTPIA